MHHDAADLIILDITLPGMTGMEVLRHLPAGGDQRPILMLTARSDTVNRIEGLDAGADDYLVKPFEMDELCARIRALSRRNTRPERAEQRIGALRFDADARMIIGPGGPLTVPRREVSLFETRLAVSGRTVPACAPDGHHSRAPLADGLRLSALGRTRRPASAADRFDRSLLVTALCISRHTAFTGGDALSRETRDLLTDTSGGPVFYHVYAPDGVFVTGYATPPVPPPDIVPNGAFAYFDAIYQGQTVRAVRFSDLMTIDDLFGEFTFTVWQDLALRDGFVQSLSQRTYVVMLTLVLSVAFTVWFGVRLGLAPLLDLQELSATIRTKDDFVSNAAHQLRNPIAGLLALSEAVGAAKTIEESHERSKDLLQASRNAAKLTEDLLAFERAKSMRSNVSRPP